VASSQTNLSILRPIDFERVHSACSSKVRAAFSGLRETDPSHGRVLTDDFNPVEFFDARNRERIRKNMADWMKSL
jgi:hypothetical protein